MFSLKKKSIILKSHYGTLFFLCCLFVLTEDAEPYIYDNMITNELQMFCITLAGLSMLKLEWLSQPALYAVEVVQQGWPMNFLSPT